MYFYYFSSKTAQIARLVDLRDNKMVSLSECCCSTDGWRCWVSAETLSWLRYCRWPADGHCTRTGNLVSRCFTALC